MKILSRLLAIFIALTYCITAAAAEFRPMISGSFYYAKINEPGIRLENKIDPSFSIGIFAKKERFITSLTTNRLTSFVSNKNASSKKTGAPMISKSKAQSDVLSIGYTFNKFAPSLLISDVRLNKKLEYQGQIISNKTKNAILTGISGTYFLDKHFSVSAFYILPNQKVNLEGAVGTSINLIF